MLQPKSSPIPHPGCFGCGQELYFHLGYKLWDGSAMWRPVTLGYSVGDSGKCWCWGKNGFPKIRSDHLCFLPIG